MKTWFKLSNAQCHFSLASLPSVPAYISAHTHVLSLSQTGSNNSSGYLLYSTNRWRGQWHACCARASLEPRDQKQCITSLHCTVLVFNESRPARSTASCRSAYQRIAERRASLPGWHARGILRLWGLSRLWMDAQTRLFLFVPCRSVRADLDGEKIQKLSKKRRSRRHTETQKRSLRLIFIIRRQRSQKRIWLDLKLAFYFIAQSALSSTPKIR